MMTNDKKISKFLSLVLRHKPEEIGLTLDKEGWADVKELLDKAKLDVCDFHRVVALNDKQRFTLNEAGTKVRAAQGHSIDVDLKYEETRPPMFLYHGTSSKNLNAIHKDGLLPMKRQHVHLSVDKETAVKVGSRHGTPVVLNVASGRMFNDGKKFYVSDNGVWLTDKVDPKYFSVSY